MELLSEVQLVCGSLLNAFGHYTRGAIVVGKIYHDGNVVFGPALNQAYELGEKTNRLPRVIVSPEALPLVITIVQVDDQITTMRGVEVDDDGQAYVDILAWPPSTRIVPRRKGPAERLLAQVRENIETAADESIRRKHEWMLRYLDGVLEECRRFSEGHANGGSR